ncbi:MAG TPA: hypothetical protein EYP10_08030, partial [Armatimonadetes bacterium]|nr:hypothetical protein [Armatimonadota bacterium]
MMSNVEWRYAIDTFQSFIARLLLLMVVGSCAFLMYGTSVGGVEESSEQAATSKANQALKASSTSRASAPVNENTVEVDASTARVIYQRRGDEWEVRTQGGTVQIRTADLTAVALNLKYHSRTGVLEIGPRIKGSVTNARFEGKLLTYTIRDRHWTLEEGLVKFEPQFFKQGVVKPVYLRGGRSEGTMDEALVHHALFTSCDRPHPHWSLRASTVRILVNDKVIARHVGVFLGRRKLLTLPRLSVSIKARRRRTTMLPDIGRNDIEGWFFKYAYTYMATRHGTGVARFDWTEKRGMGFGIEQDYAWKAAMGALFIYWLRDRYRGTEFDWRIRHQQRLSRSMRLNLQWESRSNSAYFARSVKTTILSASFQRSVSGMQTMLDVRQSNYTGWGTTKDTYITLRHNYQKNRWSASLHSTYRRFQRSYGGLGTPIAPDEELQHRLEIRHTGDVITWMLAYEQRIDLDKDKYTGDRHFGLERLPELTMRFNIGRSILRWLRNLPLYASISLGKLVEYPERTARTRLSLGTALSYHRMQLSSRLSLLTSGRFEQCFYDDGTAQYIYDLRSQLEWSWGRRSRVQLGYQLQKPHGWTPFRFDRYTPYESTDLR